MNDENRDALRDELVRDEGVRLKPYKDSVGKTSIGVGRNLDDVGISRAEAMQLLENDILRTESDLDALLPWWRGLDPVRQRVLMNMAFNMGIKSLLGFKTTLAAVRAGKYEEAATGMLNSLWAQQVGARAQRLAAMMKGGTAK